MTLQRPILTSFNAGEISPRLGGRVDQAIYQVGLETCENFVPTVEGPIVKRPGFEYITAAASSAAWLTTFRFNLLQDYAIEWSEGKLRFFTNGVRIETSPGVPYEVAVPYTAAEAPFVSIQQSYDRLYLDHPAHPPGRLTRTGATTFVYDVPQFQNGPFGDANTDQGSLVFTDGTTGNVIVYATNPIFQAGHVGALFRIEAADFSNIPAWQVGIDGITVGSVRRNEGKAYTAMTNGRTGTIAPTHTSGTEWDGSAGTDVNGKGPYGIQWQYRHDRFGIVRITAADPNGLNVHATVLRRLPDSIAAGVYSWRWAHAAFSAVAGWPSVVKAWKGRLVHFRLFDMIASVSGDYLNHAAFADNGLITADMAFRRTLSTPDPVLWAVGDRKLIVGTASVEIAIGAASAQNPVAGDNITADDQSFYGSERIFPLQAASSTFFVQRGRRKLREAQYDYGSDRYVAANATVWARHITKPGIVQLAFQKDPEELLIGVRADGQLIVHPHQPEQEIKGFARIRHSDGLAQILSGVTIASADGERDELWALVQRGSAKSIERLAAWRDDDDPVEQAFYVDSGVTATVAAGTTHFSNLTHLAGQPVAVLAAGGVVAGLSVSSTGTLDLPALAVPGDRAFTVTIGLPYTATATTLRPELKINGETSQGKKQRLVKVVLRLLGTLGLRVGPKDGKLDNLIDRPASAHMDAPIPLFSGDSQRAVSGGYDNNGQGTFISDQPVPATIVCAMPQIDVEAPR